MAYITTKTGDRIYTLDYISKMKSSSVGTNNSNLPIATIVEGKLVQDIFYTAWRGIINRSATTDSSVCTQWLEFSNFRKLLSSIIL